MTPSSVRYSTATIVPMDVLLSIADGRPAIQGDEDRVLAALIPVTNRPARNRQRRRTGLETCAAGYDMDALVKVFPDNACPAEHWGLIFRGKVRVEYS
jgi:hypothetical protein